jgi:cystathionine beta-lyase/cystathionine gamma-synthase
MEKILGGIETRLIHAGKPEPPIEGAVVTPIFQSSTFEYRGQQSYHDLRYIRLSNTPNHTGLHRKLAAIEGAEAALVTASGMAAISTTLLTILGSGDHILCQNCIYGGTHGLMSGEFPRLGIEVTFIDPGEPATWKEELRENTRAIYVETISNPLLEVGDLPAVTAFAREHGLVSVIDNTFATPINFRPAEVGFDLSLHSGTKYLNGHSDIVAGAIIGGHEIVERISHTSNHLGAALDPHACFLLDRGLKTLAVRVRYQNESALRIAQFLEQHPKIAAVHYPGLESHRDHLRACELLDGFGGVLSFEVAGGLKAAERVIERVTLPVSAPSLGGVESLITRPVTTSHSGMSAQALASAGISASLIRLSVGLEATDDLIADLDRALVS